VSASSDQQDIRPGKLQACADGSADGPGTVDNVSHGKNSV